ncbi:Zn-dependent exopeptidase [Marasmius fiardii PR-910]|nr:Zn-dependent exopeptidase [Marasmius fiardii PR-910]
MVFDRDQEQQQLVWVEQEAVDASLKKESVADEFDLFLGRLTTPHTQQHGQETFDSISLPNAVLYKGEQAALLSVRRDIASTLDTILPRFWKHTPLPASPVDYIPVPPSAIEPVERILSKLKFDPVVAHVTNSVSIAQARNDIRFLTGEDDQSGIVSRHSFSDGSRTAARWLKERFEETGATCKLKDFLPGFAPNVVCRYKGTSRTTETVLISAHYDSRGSFGSTRAPGGDDDGSGTTGLLGIARAIKHNRVKFHANVEVVAFAGEEQGLLGSKAYARELRTANANIILMVQADMTAYHHPGEPAQLGLPDLIGTPEVAQLVANISALYSPELTVGSTPVCCSDHQSFHEQGFPATQVFERAGPIMDPMYHNSGDLSDRVGYDLAQLKSIAKVQFATLLHAAGFEISK